MKHYKTKRDQYCRYWRITLTYNSEFSEWGQLLMSRTQVSQAPIPRYLPPQQLPSPDRGPEGAFSCPGSQKVTSHSYSAFLVQGEELDFLHQGEQKISFSPSQWLVEREFGLSQRKESSSYTASLRYVKEGRKEIHICFFFSIFFFFVCVCVCVVFVCLLVFGFPRSLSLRPGQFSDSVNDSTLLKAL